MNNNYFHRVSIFILMAVLCCQFTATGTPVVVNLFATGSGSVEEAFEVPEEEFTWEDVYANPTERYTWNWNYSTPLQLRDGTGYLLGTLSSVSIAVEADPRLELGFAVASGENTTHFTFSTEVLTFDEISVNTSESYALASITANNGAGIIGNFGDDDEAYQALYNGTELYADLVTPFTAGPPYFANAGYETPSISVGVTSMQAMWDFDLAGGFSASGTSEYQITADVIPEPASIVLLGLGSLVLFRKRRV